MAYERAMLVLVAISIVSPIIVATFVVAGVCFPDSRLGKLTKAPLSPGTQAANAIQQNNDAAQRTADALAQQLVHQAELMAAMEGLMVALQGIVVDRLN